MNDPNQQNTNKNEENKKIKKERRKEKSNDFNQQQYPIFPNYYLYDENSDTDDDEFEYDNELLSEELAYIDQQIQYTQIFLNQLYYMRSHIMQKINRNNQALSENDSAQNQQNQQQQQQVNNCPQYPTTQNNLNDKNSNIPAQAVPQSGNSDQNQIDIQNSYNQYMENYQYPYPYYYDPYNMYDDKQTITPNNPNTESESSDFEEEEEDDNDSYNINEQINYWDHYLW